MLTGISFDVLYLFQRVHLRIEISQRHHFKEKIEMQIFHLSESIGPHDGA